MFTHNINPVLISIFGLEIRYYGLAYVLGFLLILYILLRNKEKLKLSADEIYDYLFYLIILLFTPTGIAIGVTFFLVIYWSIKIDVYNKILKKLKNIS